MGKQGVPGRLERRGEAQRRRKATVKSNHCSRLCPLTSLLLKVIAFKTGPSSQRQLISRLCMNTPGLSSPRRQHWDLRGSSPVGETITVIEWKATSRFVVSCKLSCWCVWEGACVFLRGVQSSLATALDVPCRQKRSRSATCCYQVLVICNSS